MRHNQDVILITGKNEIHGPALERAGFSARCYPPPLTEPSIREIAELPEACAAVLEIGSDTGDRHHTPADAIARFRHRICISDAPCDMVRSYLMNAGIPDLLCSPDSGRLVRYLSTILEQVPAPAASILLLDDEKRHIDMITAILSRFDYAIELATSTGQLFSFSEREDIPFIAINLGSPILDLKQLVRGFLADGSFRKKPVIIYRDMSDGIYIHELISGLNRITPYILSPDELYSFLVEFLFRKEITPLVTSLHEKFCGSPVNFNCQSIGRIYRMHRDELFSMKTVFDGEEYDTERHVDLIKRALVKTEGLKWMISKAEEVRRITCGAGVSAV
ncbi:MAG: hypothetical protein JXA20_01605 [Spirochaetes bacterium]|nr:hypothetical protein [Spirochaetota bacterium]